MPHNLELFTAIAIISGLLFVVGMIMEVAWFFTGDRWSADADKGLLKFRIFSMVQVIPVIAAAWYLC